MALILFLLYLRRMNELLHFHPLRIIGRMYGASERYAKLLLMQFNPSLSEDQAEEKARELYRYPLF